MHRALRLLSLVLALVAAVVAGAAGPTHAASATTPDVVVSQVYAGGGNSGASYQNDFVELLNRGSAAVDLGGYTVQYATAAGTSWQVTALAGSLAAGHYYLVQLASSAAVGTALPTPDATGTTNLAATGGKVALVHGTTGLACGAAAGSCAGAADDLVGYGSATDYEGSGAAPALDSTHAAARAGAGCTDTNDNAADFTAVAPAPRNSASPAASCGGTSTPPPGSSATTSAAVTADVQPAIAIALDQPSLAFGAVATGTTPPRLLEHVTVTSNVATGYSLSVHRTAFTPADLPLGIGLTGPAGAQVPAAFGGGALVALPITPVADLLLGTTGAPTPASGDVWTASLGFTAPLPSVSPGRYQATVTFTAVGR
jgi:hypothetical protein